MDDRLFTLYIHYDAVRIGHHAIEVEVRKSTLVGEVKRSLEIAKSSLAWAKLFKDGPPDQLLELENSKTLWYYLIEDSVADIILKKVQLTPADPSQSSTDPYRPWR